MNQDNQDEHLEEVSESKFSLINYYEENGKLINIAAGVVIALVLGIWAYVKFYQPMQDEKQNAELFMTERYFVQDSLDLALNGDGISSGAMDLAGGGSISAQKASYIAGRALMEKGQFEEALDYLKDVDFDDQIVGPLASVLMGDCHAEMENYDKAASAYMKAVGKSDNQFTAPYALKKAGRAYEAAGNWDKALSVYKRLKEDFRETEFGRDMDKYIARAEIKAGK